MQISEIIRTYFVTCEVKVVSAQLYLDLKNT